VTSEKDYLRIVEHYESCLDQFGDTHKGVDWPNAHDALTRYSVMLSLIRPTNSTKPVTLLDLGCGASHMYEFMIDQGMTDVTYAGVDISPKFVDLSRSKFPGNEYHCCDILTHPDDIPEFDYLIMNGVLTEKRDLPYERMLEYAQRLIKAAFAKCKVGLAFNVMSKHVDWEREDLFHLPFDTIAPFLRTEVTPHFVFVNDYGLHEYTTYAYKEARQ
jgi:ubiquinone/menaquinone biosynthesis C-methylase UbiE